MRQASQSLGGGVAVGELPVGAVGDLVEGEANVEGMKADMVAGEQTPCARPCCSL